MPAPANTTSATEAQNGNNKTAPKVIHGTNLPAPAPDSRVDVKAKLKDGSILDYEADAKDVVTENAQTVPRISSEQAAIIASRSQVQRGRRYTELDEWLEYWRVFADEYGADDDAMDVSRFQMVVIREADVILPNVPNPYTRACIANESLGQRPFLTDINQFIGQIQSMNGNSGGRVRVILKDGMGDNIKSTWFDNRGNAVEGQQNGTWAGAIPNPIGVQTQQKEKTVQPKEDELTTLAKQMLKTKLEKLVNGEDENKSGGSNSLLDTVNATAAATVVTRLGETLTAIADSASKHTHEDKGFFGNLLNSERVQNRAIDAFETGFAFAASAAGDFLRGRQDRQRERAEMEKLQFLAQHPELANAAAAIQTQNAPAKEDAFDYIMRKCEEKDLSFNIVTDETFAGLSATERTMVRGVLASDLTPREVLSKFVTLCNVRGKGERAQKLADENLNPHTPQFIERQQRFVKESQG